MSNTANKTRGSGQGFSGRQGAKYNVLDSQIISYEFPIKATLDNAQIDTGIPIGNIAQLISGFIKVDVAEATGVTKDIDIGVTGGSGNVFMLNVNAAATGVFGTPITTVVDTSTNNTVSYRFGSADWVEFEGTLHLTFLLAE